MQNKQAHSPERKHRLSWQYNVYRASSQEMIEVLVIPTLCRDQIHPKDQELSTSTCPTHSKLILLFEADNLVFPCSPSQALIVNAKFLVLSKPGIRTVIKLFRETGRD